MRPASVIRSKDALSREARALLPRCSMAADRGTADGMRRSLTTRASPASTLSWTDALVHGERGEADRRSAPEPDLQGSPPAGAAGAGLP
jgi:hypothetical protein